MALAHCVFGIDNVFDLKLCAAPSDRSGGAPPLFGRPELKFYDDLFYPAHDPEGPGWSRKKRVFEGGFRPPKNINELFTLFTPRALLFKWGLWMTGHPIPGTKSGIIFFRHIIPKRSFG